MRGRLPWATGNFDPATALQVPESHSEAACREVPDPASSFHPRRPSPMAKLKLVVPENVTLRRDDRIYRPGDSFEAERDDEVEQWLRHGYAREVKVQKRSAKRK
jgi:hypothetical protein